MKKLLLLSIFFFLAEITGYSQDMQDAPSSEDAEAAVLAKATQNPLAAMYSLPFQNNTTFGVGSEEKTQNVLNIQPVIPITLTKNINLINRVIIPVITQPYGNDGVKSSTGVGDISYTAWFSPSKASKLIGEWVLLFKSQQGLILMNLVLMNLA